MNKKYMVIALTVAFLLGISSLGLCLTDKHGDKSDCCSDKSAPVSAPSEDCLWHCAAKKIVGAKAENFSLQSLKTGTPLFLQYRITDIPSHSLRHSNSSIEYYLGSGTPRLAIPQIYFATISNRAPPVIR